MTDIIQEASDTIDEVEEGTINLIEKVEGFFRGD